MPERSPLVHRLLSEMTLSEKVGQLHQIYSESPIDLESIRNGEVGSIIYSNGAYAGNDRQSEIAAEEIQAIDQAGRESRLGIPPLVARDVIHGYRTIAPIPLGQAASWSPADIQAAAEVASREAASEGINWVFSPIADIARDPRWGRVAEGYGEDPHLTSILVSAAVKGLQASGQVAACVKHFVGYGSAEGGRDYNTAEITPFTLHNIHLPSFQAAIDAGVSSLMSCFNDLGGIPMTANRHFLSEILRDRLAFEGPIVSDWNAVAELMDHGIAASRRDATQLAFNAGIDIDMISGCFRDEMIQMVESDLIHLSSLDNSVARVLGLKERLGLLESRSRTTLPHFSPESQQTVLDLARKSLVLLKNDGSLPLANGIQKIGLFGPMANVRSPMNGTWTLDGRESEVVTVEEGLRNLLDPDQELVTTAFADEALHKARHCDAVIAVVGEHPLRSGEANSITRLELPPGQIEFLQALRRTATRLVVVVVSGRPLAIPWLEENADAILWAFHPGSLGGRAIAEVLLGITNPSGKLPMTFPRDVGQVPIYYNHMRTGRPLDPYANGESRYVDEKDSPLYPFGYGLSYSDFEYRDLNVDGTTVTCSVTNTNQRDGTEIVQLYLRDQVATFTRPVKELKAFRRQLIPAGETAKIQFDLEPESFGFFTPDGSFRIEAGKFDVWVGPSSISGLHGEIAIQNGSPISGSIQ